MRRLIFVLRRAVCAVRRCEGRRGQGRRRRPVSPGLVPPELPRPEGRPSGGGRCRQAPGHPVGAEGLPLLQRAAPRQFRRPGDPQVSPGEFRRPAARCLGRAAGDGFRRQGDVREEAGAALWRPLHADHPVPAGDGRGDGRQDRQDPRSRPDARLSGAGAVPHHVPLSYGTRPTRRPTSASICAPR